MKSPTKPRLVALLSVIVGLVLILAIPTSLLNSGVLDAGAVAGQVDANSTETGQILSLSTEEASVDPESKRLAGQIVTETESRVVTEVAAQDPQEDTNNPDIPNVPSPESADFNIIIPKIGLNKAIYPNVDPTDKEIYLPILDSYVAHGLWTSKPDEGGNTYLFAHSGTTSGWFTRLDELSSGSGDEIIVHYKGKVYTYHVVSSSVVEPSETSVYTSYAANPQLTLQTCYPRGTTEKRLIIIATLVDVK